MIFVGHHLMSFAAVSATWRMIPQLWLVVGIVLAGAVGGKATESREVEKELAAIAYAGRIIGNDARMRFILNFDRKVTQTSYVLADPKRLIIDLSETVFSLDSKSMRSPSPLVKDVRYGTVAPGKSRVVMELGKAVKIAKVSLSEIKGKGRHRLLLDLVPTSEKDFLASVRKSEPSRSGGKVAHKGDRVAPVVKQDRVFTIVIDPGHGGIDGGAVGKGRTVEKNITLRFAKALRKKLSNNPAFKVLLTREKDTFVSLQDRIDFAHRHHADLMISVHADSLRQRSIRGATVYTLSEEGTDELSRQLAHKQNRADLIAGLSLPKVDDSVTDILIDLTRRETEVFSTRFARMLVNQMKKDIKLIKNPHRSADFFVLKAADIPSVLLELGYLSNREDEKLMRSTKWQDKAADKAARAAIKFFAPRMAAQ